MLQNVEIQNLETQNLEVLKSQSLKVSKILKFYNFYIILYQIFIIKNHTLYFLSLRDFVTIPNLKSTYQTI
jgi:hypothetical protein